MDNVTQFEQSQDTVEELKKEIHSLKMRSARMEEAVKRTLEIAIRSEQLNELTVTTVLQKVFSSMSETLVNSIVEIKKSMDSTNQDYLIEVVNHEDILSNEESILVIKGEDGFIYSRLETPDNVIQSGMEVFDNYFADRPQLFEDSKEVIVNIYIRKKGSEDNGQ